MRKEAYTEPLVGKHPIRFNNLGEADVAMWGSPSTRAEPGGEAEGLRLEGHVAHASENSDSSHGGVGRGDLSCSHVIYTAEDGTERIPVRM